MPVADGGLGTIETILVADTPCVPGGGTSAELYDAPKAVPGFRRLESVGSRRLASGEAFVLFDGAGTNPSTDPIYVGSSLNASGSEGATVGVGAVDSTELSFQRFDAQGATVGGRLALESSTLRFPDLSLAGSNGTSLLVWRSGLDLRAIGVTAAGATAGPSFTFGAGSFETRVAFGIAPAPDGFAIAWAGDSRPGGTRLSFVKASLTGIVGAPVRITGVLADERVVRLARTKTGYVMLLDEGQTGIDTATYVLRLDDDGNPIPPTYKFLGTSYAYDMAIQGEEIGIVARRKTGEPMFRALDKTGAPLGSWVCLAGSLQNVVGGYAIDVDGAGYAAVGTMPDNSTRLFRFDRLGTGPL